MPGFNLFALTNDASQRVVRLPLAIDVQDQITATFRTQEGAFQQVAQQSIDFDGKYKPEDDECLVIRNYDDIDGLHAAIADPLTIPEISPDTAAFDSIKALFSGYKDASGVSNVLIQSFERKRVLSNTGFSLFYSSNVYKRVEGVGLTIDNKLSAILKGSELYFFSFFAARQIFDLSQHYIEATDSDIKDFATISTVRVENVVELIELSDTWIRRKLSLIKQSGVLTTVPMGVIKQVAAEFKINIATEIVGQVEVVLMPRNKAELKKVLRFLDEDYYKSSLLSRLHIANSKRLA